MSEELFETYPVETRVFYKRIIFVMMLNAAAVRHELFDVLLSDTDDIFTWMRFYDAIPQIQVKLGLFME